ncbi:MAG: Fe-Mn family superoxide dismutase [Wenzhouxiangella sp.]|nr:Fe-Mn family superoxide dismutase [Wenzhouxiangella sp.]
MAFTLPPLPYDRHALEPHISAETLDLHYGKHNQTYVDKLNGLIEGTDFADQSLEEIIKASDGGVFNNAAQMSNHDIYWQCMSPNGGGEPSGALADKINATFGDYATFKKQFTEAAVNVFGSGWAWLVQQPDHSLAIKTTSNAGTPITHGDTPLLACDMWEHSYYVDYRNARPKYMEAFWSVVNWDYAAAQLS